MARPKEKTTGSAAFQQKCVAAGDKLRKYQSDMLREDVERLFTEELHADLTVAVGLSTLPLHSLLIRARSEQLYEMLMSLPGCSLDNKIVTLETDIPISQIQDIFRQLYTEDDVSEIIFKLEKILTKSTEPEVESLSPQNAHLSVTDTIKLEASINNIINNAADSQKQVDNNKDNNIEYINLELHAIKEPLDDKALKTLAEIIVTRLILKAVQIVKNDENAKLDEAVTLTNSDVNIEQIDGGNPKQAIKTDDVISNNEDRIKRTHETSDEPISSLLERVYSVKTACIPCGQLGEDLLRMLLTRDTCDCVVQVDGECFHAHKCILAARSSYFAAMLGGSWKESEEELVVLEGIDPGIMKQTLLYLYGGVIEVDPTCTLGGLIMMADMYAMEGLKEVVSFNLNMEYCHFFHRPCPGCIAGVPEALALTMMYNMDTLKDKCVKWINKNFGKVWATKTFASLPQEVLEFCAANIVKDLALDNVIDTMVECQRLNEKTPHVKWTEPIFDMITQLMEASIEYASQNFIHLVASNTFRKIDQTGIAFNRQPLEDIFSMVIMALSPESSCQAYLSLNKWVVILHNEEKEQTPTYTKEFSELVECLFQKCKDHLCLYIHQAANTVEWGLLSKDMQTDMMKEANYVCIESKNRVARPKLSSMQKKISATSPLSLKEYFDRHFGNKDTALPQTAKPKSRPKSTVTKGPTLSGSASNSSKETKGKQESTRAKTANRNTGRTNAKNKESLNQGSKSLGNKMSKVSTEKNEVLTKYKNAGDNKMTGLSSAEGRLPKLRKSEHFVKQRSNELCSKNNNAAASNNGTSNSDCGHIETDEELSDTSTELQENPSMEESIRSCCQATWVSTFKPHFGVKAEQSEQSVDSFFYNTRQGPVHILEVQRPLPTLEFSFIAPYEFLE